MTVTFFGRAFSSGVFVQIAQKTDVASGATTTTPWTALGAGQTFEWFVTAKDATLTTTGPTWTFSTTATTDPVFVGAGDIAECSNPGDESTAATISGVAGQVFTVGDNVYPDGALVNFNNCYDPSWGGSIKARTRPTTGNHDWAPGNLTGYFAYYGASAGGNSYYSYDIAGSNWHVVVLDTECTFVAGGCGVGSAQVNWLTSDLNANPTKNVIAMIHRPRYSSGATNQTDLQPLYDVMYQHHVDIVLQGHDHIYERQAPMNAAGAADPAHGMRVFTVGTGGQSHHGISSVRATSEVRDNTTFGIFKLTLHASTYDWKFLPIAGATFTDSGTGSILAKAANQAPGRGRRQLQHAPQHGPRRGRPGRPRQRHRRRRQPLTAAVVTSVTHGSLTLTANGGFTYTPTAGYTGPDSFTYRANDGTPQLEHRHGQPDRHAGGGGNNGVQLNGSSQYITFGAAPGLNASTYTLELWFKRTGAGVGTSTGTGGIASAIPLLTKGRAEAETPANLNMDWFLGIDATSGQLVADFEDNATGANHPVTGTAVVTSNVWHHVAATYGAGTWNLYLDGVLDKTLAVGAFTPEATSIQHAALGTAMTSTGVAAGFFQGVVDEARVWNVVRTAAQIAANKNLELTSGTGLIGRWGLNEGSGTTAANSVSGGVAGTLVGTPTWVPGFVRRVATRPRSRSPTATRRR